MGCVCKGDSMGCVRKCMGHRVKYGTDMGMGEHGAQSNVSEQCLVQCTCP